MELQSAFENFLLTRKLAGLSPKTIVNYRQTVFLLVNHIGGDKLIEDISQDDINNYIAMIIEKSTSKATKSTYIRHAKVFLKWMDTTYAVNYNYKLIKVPKTPKKVVKIYSDEELKCILDTVSAESEWLIYRNKAIISLMYDSGLRQSEVCTLRCGKVSFKERLITVYGKGAKERIVPLGNVSIYFLKKYMEICPYKSQYIFVDRYGNMLTCNSIKVLIHKLAKQLPFELSSHKLRHNFATNYCLDQYEKNGQIDIYSLKYIMGHVDVETTEKYLHFAMNIIASKGNISHLDKILGLEN